jgi:phage-related tail protein
MKKKRDEILHLQQQLRLCKAALAATHERADRLEEKLQKLGEVLRPYIIPEGNPFA